jgi:hypothetical protein
VAQLTLLIKGSDTITRSTQFHRGGGGSGKRNRISDRVEGRRAGLDYVNAWETA